MGNPRHVNHTKEFCECGGAIHVAGPGSQSILLQWQKWHAGPGHMERVTAVQADKIRNSRERGPGGRRTKTPDQGTDLDDASGDQHEASGGDGFLVNIETQRAAEKLQAAYRLGQSSGRAIHATDGITSRNGATARPSVHREL